MYFSEETNRSQRVQGKSPEDKKWVSVRLVRGALEYIRKFYPQVKLDEFVAPTKLPLSFYYDESNSISLVDINHLHQSGLKYTHDPEIAINTGRFGMSIEALGPWMFHFLKITHTPQRLYRKLMTMIPLVNGFFDVKFSEPSPYQANFHWRFKALKLTPAEEQGLIQFQEVTFKNTQGYFQSIPTLLGLPEAKVLTVNKSPYGREFSFELACQYDPGRNFLSRISHYNDEPSYFLLPADWNLLTQLNFGSKRAPVKLTRREAECLVHLLRGRIAQEVAIELSLSRRTVESYWDSVRGKLGCESKSEVYDLVIRKLSEAEGYSNILLEPDL